MPRVCFLLPVRDALTTLPAAIASIRAQTVEDWALVVVDDGSGDGTGAWLEAEARRDQRLQIVHQAALGLVPALNAGLARCDAEFIARMDADDLLEPQRLSRQLAMLDADRHLAVVDGQVAFFRDDDEVPEGMHRYGRWVNSILTPADFDRELLVESPVVHPAATLRRAAVHALGGYRDGDFPEDYDLWLRLHAAGWRLAKVPEVVIRMRDRPTRLTRTDPRYSQAGFRRVRQEWLTSTVLASPRRVVLWGAGRAGRPWLRWLLDHGHQVQAVVDIDPHKIGRRRRGVPIIAPPELPSFDAEIGLVAVGARGARTLIREALSTLRPDWQEGRHWWAVQ